MPTADSTLGGQVPAEVLYLASETVAAIIRDEATPLNVKMTFVGRPVGAAIAHVARTIMADRQARATRPEAQAGGGPALSVQNPIEELRLAALDAFPDLRCRVLFAAFPEEGPYGETFFPDDGGDPTVQVAVGIPMEAVIEVMAHELAHVAAGLGADHGPAWEAAFAAIHAAYSRRMSAAALPEREKRR